jgi:uncharacterized membrane protein
MVKNHRTEIARAKSIQEKFALAVTGFAGTMLFVYIHVIVFAVWIISAGFGHDPFPFQFLTMAVSLEAIILSTLVMIGQNTQSKHADIRAELDYQVNVQAEKENQDIIKLLNEIKNQRGG